MYRRLVALYGPVLFVAVAQSAPVPRHLLPKEPPFPHPTAVGTKWVYEAGRAEETLVLTKAEWKDGAALVTIETEKGAPVRSQKVLVSAVGWFVVEGGGEAYNAPMPILKLPHRVGQKWDLHLTRGNNRLAFKGWSRATAPGLVKVPAGEFAAVAVKSNYTVKRVSDGELVNDFSLGTTHWYVSGVGLVRVDEPVGRTQKVLKSFTLGKE